MQASCKPLKLLSANNAQLIHFCLGDKKGQHFTAAHWTAYLQMQASCKPLKSLSANNAQLIHFCLGDKKGQQLHELVNY
jgi:hypothetical protein